MEYKDKLNQELLNGSKQMYQSILNDDLTKDEIAEWWGYIRAFRDVAFFIDVKGKNIIQRILEDALDLKTK